MLNRIQKHADKLLLGLYIFLPLIAALKQYLNGSFNNYLVFKYTFINTIDGKTLYGAQPQFFHDSNYYGPFFGMFFAPFAMLPNAAGIILWAIFVSLCLFFAIRRLSLPANQQNLILLICAHELLTSLFNLQSNALIGSLIILTFVYSIKHKEVAAGFLIAVGFLIKLYGVVGFAFIVFSKNWFKYIGSFIGFAILLALLPISISSVPFQIQEYKHWFEALSNKNKLNLSSTMQNISAIGLINKNISSNLSTFSILIGGLGLMLMQVLANIKNLKSTRFQYLLLSSILLFTVLFSTGSESATYIIAFPGVAIWYVTKEEKTFLDHFLLTFAIIITSFSPSDLFPPEARSFIREYKLKALPCFIIWLEIIRESCFCKFRVTKYAQ